MYLSTLCSSLLSTLFFAGLSSAHLKIASPVPIDSEEPKSPLLRNGANFPAHNAVIDNSRSSDRSLKVPRKTMRVGEVQKLVFDTEGGLAVAAHGGGSCQLSLTYAQNNQEAQDPNNYHVILSIIEGCPTNHPSNLSKAKVCPEGSTETDCYNSFKYTIPPEARNGRAHLCWTWFNNIGNREMYMECSPVYIEDGQDRLEELPKMFVANIQSLRPQCKTTEGVNVMFPDPGKYVIRGEPAGPVAKRYPIEVPKGCGPVKDRISAPGNSIGGGAAKESGKVGESDPNNGKGDIISTQPVSISTQAPRISTQPIPVSTTPPSSATTSSASSSTSSVLSSTALPKVSFPPVSAPITVSVPPASQSSPLPTSTSVSSTLSNGPPKSSTTSSSALSESPRITPAPTLKPSPIDNEIDSDYDSSDDENDSEDAENQSVISSISTTQVRTRTRRSVIIPSTPSLSSTPTTLLRSSSTIPTPASGATPVGAAPSLDCPSSYVPCNSVGFYCVSREKFGICSWGCARPSSLAHGTICENDSVVWDPAVMNS